jgi:two-component system, cell cycle response regulator DivK
MKKRVLIVEDQPDVRTMMKMLIRSYGFDVIEAADGYEAVELAVEQHPDVILMDMAMPVLDGLYANRAIRQHDDLAKVPILAVTAYGDFYKDRAIEAGCTDVLQKPLDFGNLQPLVQSYVQ